MERTTSADGTPIAWHRVGHGPVVVIVGGAFSTAPDAAPLADALDARGLAGVTYDRRARGDSGDTAPYAPDRETEDLAAVIQATGGVAAVLGHSSGAVLALYAASRGVPMTRLFLSEPPFRFGVDEPAPDLPERLQALVDSGDRGGAVTTFQIEGVGLPAEMVEQIRQSPIFPGLEAVAQSTVYDATLTRDVSTPTVAMREVGNDVTVLLGSETFPILTAAAHRLVDEMPQAELVEVPESKGHRPDPAATAAVIAARVA
ncbi:alpha/beta fold hydrolase [Microbacterium gorillae]|uniref:alpha/beta fold hydrolase n=1 Tax=Microbacterium gorillae TaxID=1231063 RepID=UPI00058ECEA6|nr:alpha/beta hydrolase [Microbacterium gorillae]